MRHVRTITISLGLDGDAFLAEYRRQSAWRGACRMFVRLGMNVDAFVRSILMANVALRDLGDAIRESKRAEAGFWRERLGGK